MCTNDGDTVAPTSIERSEGTTMAGEEGEFAAAEGGGAVRPRRRKRSPSGDTPTQVESPKSLLDLVAQLTQQNQQLNEALRKTTKGFTTPPSLLSQFAEAQASYAATMPQATIPSFTSSVTSRPPDRIPDTKEAKPEVALVANHAPNDWSSQDYASELRGALRQHRTMDLFVLCADIRASTLLMKEAIDPFVHATLIGSFVENARKLVLADGGWWGVFTGDGFLAFWPHRRTRLMPTLPFVLNGVKSLFSSFYEETLPVLKANSQNFPSGVGLAIGLAAGPATLVSILKDLAIVGPSVVGAVRMVSAARAGETLANSYLGESFMRAIEQGRIDDVSVTQDWRPTKEYPTGQAVYAVQFTDLTLPE
jgi:class 3 adenylate cyclase